MSSLDRAAKYGGYGAIAVSTVQIGTLVLFRAILTNSGVGALEENVVILAFFGVAATALAVVLLFMTMARYVHLELDARGLDGSES